MKELYPFLLQPIFKSTIWGGDKLHRVLGKETGNEKHVGESWEISGVSDNISVITNGFLAGNNLQELLEVYMGEIVGEHVFEKFGIEFPLLIKFIDATDILSLQVHPDDVLAKQRHNAFGKTEMWYILDAEPGAEIIIGFNRKVSREDYLNHLRDKNLRDILNIEHPKKGDVFFLPPGRIHAIGAGIMLAEIQQTSDITYRIYDWDRVDQEGKSRELHTDLALDAIDFNFYDSYKTQTQVQSDTSTALVHCDYFNTQLIHLTRAVEKDYYSLDSCIIYIGLEGKTMVQYEQGEVVLEKGKTLLIPAIVSSVNLIPESESRFLEVFVP